MSLNFIYFLEGELPDLNSSRSPLLTNSRKKGFGGGHDLNLGEALFGLHRLVVLTIVDFIIYAYS